MYRSESFKTNHINIVKTLGYNLWQYSSVVVGDKSTEFNNDKTPIRKITKPIHLLGLYGKWLVLIFVIYTIINFLVNIVSSV